VTAGERRATPGAKLERAVLLALLNGDPGQRTSREELAAELGADAGALEDALGRLSHAGVVCGAGSEVWASAAAWHIDQLGLIGV